MLIAHGGGPTPVINSSLLGAVREAKTHGEIETIYGARFGAEGILAGDLIDLGKFGDADLALLAKTPASALGSCRRKLTDADYPAVLECFKKFNIRYFFYNGGNDSMDTCNKVSKFMKKSGWECRVIGVPKTIDNDLYGTDHCPGYGSAAKYVATTMMELKLDANVYDTPMITVVEIMGRHAGWLTAAASLANYKGLGADLIYLPEVPFSVEKFKSDVKAVMEKNNNKCMVAVSEGISDANGKLIAEVLAGDNLARDSFGHAQLGGVGAALANMCKAEFGCKTRAVEFSLMQRCGAHLASKTDVEEAFKAGAAAVKYAVKGTTDKMVILKRDMSSGKYKCKVGVMSVAKAANAEKKVPLEWIINDGTMLSQEYVDYALPLIQGDSKAPLEDGLPRFAKLKKVLAKK